MTDFLQSLISAGTGKLRSALGKVYLEQHKLLVVFSDNTAAAVCQLRLGHRRKLKIATSVRAMKAVYNNSKC